MVDGKEQEPCERRDPKGRCLPPKIDFSTYIVSLGTTAMVGLGLAPHPESQKIEIDLWVAQQNIDILKLLLDKTKGNLNEAEEKLLRTLLYDMQMAFVRQSKR